MFYHEHPVMVKPGSNNITSYHRMNHFSYRINNLLMSCYCVLSIWFLFIFTFLLLPYQLFLIFLVNLTSCALYLYKSNYALWMCMCLQITHLRAVWRATGAVSYRKGCVTLAVKKAATTLKMCVLQVCVCFNAFCFLIVAIIK